MGCGIRFDECDKRVEEYTSPRWECAQTLLDLNACGAPLFRMFFNAVLYTVLVFGLETLFQNPRNPVHFDIIERTRNSVSVRHWCQKSVFKLRHLQNF